MVLTPEAESTLRHKINAPGTGRGNNIISSWTTLIITLDFEFSSKDNVQFKEHDITG